MKSISERFLNLIDLYFDKVCPALIAASAGCAALICVSAVSLHADAQNPNQHLPGTEGIQIMTVDPGSVYETMNVESGDVLLEVNDRQVRRVQELDDIFKNLTPGSKVRYKLQHKGRTEEREMLSPEITKARTPANSMSKAARDANPRPNVDSAPRAPAPTLNMGPNDSQPIVPNPVPPASMAP